VRVRNVVTRGRRRRSIAAVVFALACACAATACGKVPSASQDAGPDGGGGSQALTGARGVAGAAHVEGGSFSIDVQVGEPLSHGTVQGGNVTADDTVLR